ncbi:uncharacterized protein TNCV_3299521 [Trichonephila clavipes]|uniref:Uncharacterized protein n=1 Tax=Trichonephila clavipes TaxID=2585209 RepID=A0A8X6VTU4_TRICX|nr:uncharacterized protein TNCV_3299521 [Trichonephila clavipes]
MSRKEILGYKQSRDSLVQRTSEEAEEGAKTSQGEKRQLTLSNNSELQSPRKRYRGDEIVTPSTSGYNLRPRRGAKVESRSTIEMRTQQGGPVRARESQENHYSPYIEEQARPSSKNTRRRSSQQQNRQERKGGVNSNRSISLEVLVGDVNYKP